MLRRWIVLPSLACSAAAFRAPQLQVLAPRPSYLSCAFLSKPIRRVPLVASIPFSQRHSSPKPPPLFAVMSSPTSSQDPSSTGDGAAFKRAKLEGIPVSTKTIGTHSGTFQADEAMGVWMLRQVPEYWNAKVTRSREDAVLSKLDIVIDVGGVYDHQSKRYDHHQRGYDERFYNDAGRCTKLSASGLVYRHYGHELIATRYPNLSESQARFVYDKVYNRLLEALDAIDTGVEACPPGVELLYKDSTGLSSRVARINPRWNELDSEGLRPSEDERFEQAVLMCGADFVSVLTGIVESDLPAQSIVQQAVQDRYKVDSSGEIVLFPNGGLPWRDHLYEAERCIKVGALVKFVLYQDVAGMYVRWILDVKTSPRPGSRYMSCIAYPAHAFFVNNRWRVQAVTVEGKAFENRLSLPVAWRGLRDEALEAVASISGCRFVHAAGFIGGNNSYEGALEMARAALKSAAA
jgi:uncharacterized UPF0160 family protein